jgi:hypothetical protein
MYRLTEEERREERCKECTQNIRMTYHTYGCKLSYHQEPKSIENCPLETKEVVINGVH